MRFLLCNLKEANAQFKMHHLGVEVGFSKFADLWPKQCVLAGARGTHSECLVHDIIAVHLFSKSLFKGCACL